MLKRLFPSRPSRLSLAVHEEVGSICRAAQIEQLQLSPHVKRDLGLDCGCTGPDRPR